MPQSTIRKIQSLEKHPDADRLEIVKLEGLGWQVIAQSGLHKVGDLVIYVEIDSVVPERECFEFLRNKNWRVKTIKLRKQISQGLILPLVDFGIDPGGVNVGDCVDDITGIVHYEKPVPVQLAGQIRKNQLPPGIPKTDEERIQNCTDYIEKFQGRECYVALKHDGSSATYFMDEDSDFHVCSRNLDLKMSSDNIFWRMAFKYGLNENLTPGECLQAELIGNGVQKNKEGLKDNELRVFNYHVVRSDNNELFAPYGRLVNVCKRLEVPKADLFYEGIFEWKNLQELLDLADSAKYANGSQAEGLVFRLLNPQNRNEATWSFKVISNKFLLKNEE